MPQNFLQGIEVFRMPIVYRGKGVSGRLARNVFINPCDLGNLLQVLVYLLLGWQGSKQESSLASLAIVVDDGLGEWRKRHRYILSRFPPQIMQLAMTELLDAQILGIADMRAVTELRLNV